MSFITTKAPSTFPKSRIHSDSGVVNTSSILIGVITTIGSVKLFSHLPTPFLRIPAYSIIIILNTARAIVMFRSFVGGLKPNIPITLAIPI